MIYHMPMGTAPSACCEQCVSLISAFTSRALVSRGVGGREESDISHQI